MALKDQLVAHWSLEEASGSRTDDIGGNTLTSNNSVGQATGKVGNAAQFVAASSKSLSIADNTALSMGDIDFTICAWVYLDSKPATAPIVAKDGSGQREYLLDYESSSDRFRFYIFNAAGSNKSLSAAAIGSPSLATWYFLVAWHDSIGDTINIQVNNGSVSSSATAALVVNDSTAAFRIGSRDLGSFFDGRIDEVGVWKRVLTTQERTDLYNSGNGLAFSQFSGTYTLSGSGTAQAATGSGAGLQWIPVKTLSGSGTAQDATGGGAGLVNTAPVYSLSGSGVVQAATGSGAGLVFTPPVYSLSGSATAQGATGSGAGLTFIPVKTLSGSAQADAAMGSGAGLLWIPDIIPAKTFVARARGLDSAALARPTSFAGDGRALSFTGVAR